jgi:hypothetical protein
VRSFTGATFGEPGKPEQILGKKEKREAEALKAGPPLGLKRNNIAGMSNN